MTYRLFVAVELSDAVQSELQAVQAQLRAGRPPVRWVAPEAMHLTLQFLGACEEALVPQVDAALRVALAGISRHTLELGGLGAFPNPRRPNVIWAGVVDRSQQLAQAQARIADALEPLGFAREARPFHPHLTLGRVRREATQAERERLGAALGHLSPPARHVWGVQRIVLFQSDLGAAGPRYTPQAIVDLL